MPETDSHLRRVKIRKRGGGFCFAGGVYLAQGPCAGVIVIDVFSSDGPTAVRDPRPLRKVEILQGGAPTLPATRGATEVAHPTSERVRVFHAGALSVVERLRSVVRLEAATLEKANAETRVRECQCECDTGGAGSDDADIAP